MSPSALNDILHRLLEQQPAFRSFVRRRVKDDALAEDLLQQSLTRALERLHTVKNDESAVAWFYRILRHAIVDFYRAQAAEQRKGEAFLGELTARGEDKVPSLDEVKAEICACFQRLLPAMRSNYAEMIRRIDLEEEPASRVAQDLKISQNNLTVRLHRARQALRAGLEQACGICSQHGCLNCTCETTSQHS